MIKQAVTRRAVMAGFAAGGLGGVAGNAYAEQGSTWEQIQKSGRIRAGLIPNRAPYQWIEDGDVQGFIGTMIGDFTGRLGEKMGRKIAIEYVETTNQTTILDLQSNRIDVYIPLTVTAERKAAIDMFGPLYLMPVVAFNRRGFDPGPRWEDYNKPGTRISVVMGTTDEQAARQRLPSATIRALKDTSEAVLEVQSGHSDAAVLGLLLGLIGMKKNPNLGSITVLQPIDAPPSDGGTRKDGDGRFARFMQEWAAAYQNSGGATPAVFAAMKEAGLRVEKIPPGVKF